MITIWPIPMFSDNYAWALESNGVAAVVDPGDADPVIESVGQRGLRLSAILLTHRHDDHVGGASELVARGSVPVYGPARERIGAVDRPVSDGEAIPLEDLEVEVVGFDVPGHTAGHIAFSGPGFVFAGDTLFAGGCGRVFEGTPAQMVASLRRIAELPRETEVYCGHEYTVSNLRFARLVDPANQELAARLEEAVAARRQHLPTVPSTLDLELRTNPYLRCSEPAVREAAEGHAGRTLDDEAEVFAVIRAWKDGWRG